jgi:formylglycine-generating enzyme required for sulfatase activity
MIVVLFVGASIITGRNSLPDTGAFEGMVLIPGGTFDMGGVNGENDEKPIHRVLVNSFYLGETEVTIWEYLQCVQAGGCRMPFWWNRRFFDQKVDDMTGKQWLSLPVTGVSWDDAQAYCAWKGNGLRLPTEAEWEYAARGKTQTEYFWGKSNDSATKYAAIGKKILPVKSRLPNQFKLFDMAGSVWQWCQDRYDKHYYQKSPSDNPLGPADSTHYPYRVVRGGSWKEYLWNCRCANRNYGEQFRRFDGVGFRICRSAP